MLAFEIDAFIDYFAFWFQRDFCEHTSSSSDLFTLFDILQVIPLNSYVVVQLLDLLVVTSFLLSCIRSDEM